jgi:hypothetical protein
MLLCRGCGGNLANAKNFRNLRIDVLRIADPLFGSRSAVTMLYFEGVPFLPCVLGQERNAEFTIKDEGLGVAESVPVADVFVEVLFSGREKERVVECGCEAHFGFSFV